MKRKRYTEPQIVLAPQRPTGRQARAAPLDCSTVLLAISGQG